jgi:hypothetical protein
LTEQNKYSSIQKKHFHIQPSNQSIQFSNPFFYSFLEFPFGEELSRDDIYFDDIRLENRNEDKNTVSLGFVSFVIL